MSPIVRKPLASRSTHSLPTLEQLAATFAIGSLGITGCNNPFQPTPRETRPVVAPDAVPLPCGLAALFTTGVTTHARPHRDPWLHVAPIAGTAATNEPTVASTPTAVANKDEPFAYASGGGAMVSVGPYRRPCTFRGIRHR